MVFVIKLFSSVYHVMYCLSKVRPGAQTARAFPSFCSIKLLLGLNWPVHYLYTWTERGTARVEYTQGDTSVNFGYTVGVKKMPI